MKIDLFKPYTYSLLLTTTLLSLCFSCIAVTTNDLNAGLQGENIGEQLDNEAYQEEFFPEHDTKEISFKKGTKNDKDTDSLIFDAKDKIKFKLNSVRIDGNTVYSYSNLEPLFKNYLGKEANLSDLYEIRRKIKEHYQDNGYVLTEVIIPHQRINKNSSAALFRVIESHFSNIKYSNVDNIAIHTYAQAAKAHQPIRLDILEYYLLLMNRLPGTEVSAVISKSQNEVGASELLLNIKETNTKAYVNLDNYANKNLKNFQFKTGFSTYNFFGANELNINFAVSPTYFEGMFYVNGNYKQVLPNLNGLTLSIGAEYSKVKAQDDPLKSIGKSKRLSLDATYPASLKRGASKLVSIGAFYFNNESRNTSLEYKDRLFATHLGYNAHSTYNILGFKMSKIMDFSFTTSIWIDDKHNTSRQTHSLDNVTSFKKFKYTGTFELPIKNNISFFKTITAQYPLNNLISSEQLSFGGERIGAGYKNSSITGDYGFVSLLELRYNYHTNNHYLDRAQFFIAKHNCKLVDYPNTFINPFTDTIGSYSIGVRAHFINDFVGSFTIGIPKDKHKKLTDSQNADIRLYFSLKREFNLA